MKRENYHGAKYHNAIFRVFFSKTKVVFIIFLERNCCVPLFMFVCDLSVLQNY